jgi:hypothetical protein
MMLMFLMTADIVPQNMDTDTADGKQAFLILGDSISRGTSITGKGTTPEPGTVFEYDGTQILEVGADDLSTSNTGSQYPQMGRDYFNLTGNKCVFINTAYGGAEFSPNGDSFNWASSGVLYEQMKSKVSGGLLALGINKLKGIILLLGINDARGSVALATVQNDVNSLFSRLGADFQDTPLYVVNIGRSETAISNERIDAVRGYIQTAISGTPGAKMIFDLRKYATETPAFYGPDNLHLNISGCNALGSEIAIAIAPKLTINRSIHNIAADGRYNAFGTLVTISATKKMYVFRSGTDHLVGGTIDALDYDVPTNTWSNRRTLLTPPVGTDYRDPRVSVINGSIYIFTSRRNNTTGLTEAAGYFRSTDLTGTSWSSFNELTKTLNYCLPWGKMVAGDVAGTYFQPFYETNLVSGGAWKVGLFKTTNNGDTWTPIYMHNGTYPVTETTVVNLGGGKMLSLSRVEGGYGVSITGLVQMTSSDGGNTWTTPIATNIGSTNINVPSLYYNGSTLLALFQNRATGWLQVSLGNNPLTVFNSPTSWQTAQNYEYNASANDHPSRKGLGYPDYDGLNVVWNFETYIGGVERADVRGRQEDFSQW